MIGRVLGYKSPIFLNLQYLSCWKSDITNMHRVRESVYEQKWTVCRRIRSDFTDQLGSTARPEVLINQPDYNPQPGSLSLFCFF